MLNDLPLKDLAPVLLNSDNQTELYISANPDFHERIKHIEVDCHYIRGNRRLARLNQRYMSTKSEVANVGTNQSQSLISRIHGPSWISQYLSAPSMRRSVKKKLVRYLLSLLAT